MPTDEKTGPSWVMRLLAVLVLAVAAWFLVKIVIHVVLAVAFAIAVVVAVVGVIWAFNTLRR